MYAALNENRNLVYARDALDNHHYFCPKCGQKLELRRSIKDNKFFRHQSACGNRPQVCRQESQIHQAGKRLILENARSHGHVAKLEYKIRALDQIVDVIMMNQEILSIWEFQKSKISHEVLESRHNQYLKISPEVYWIIADQELARPYSSWFKSNVHYCSKWGHYLITLNTQANCLKIYHHLPTIVSKDTYHLNYYRLDHGEDWQDFLRQKKSSANLTRRYQRRPYDRIHSILKNSSYAFHLKRIYQEGLTLGQFPPWIFQRAWEVLYFKEAGWIVLTWAYLAMRKKIDEEALTVHLTRGLAEGVLHLQENVFIRGSIIDQASHMIYHLFKRLDQSL